VSSAGGSTRTAGGKETASIQAVSDKAKRSKLLTRTPLMHTAATIGLLGTAAAHADVINATAEQAAKDLGATVTMEPTCRGRKHAIDMMKSLRSVLTVKQLRRIGKVAHIAVSCDESTCISTKGQMVVYVSYWCEERNEAVVEFLTIKTLPGGKAPQIIDALRQIFPGSSVGEPNEVGSLWSKFVHLGSDGCSAMTGKDTGVGPLLRKEIKDLLQLHCCNHRLALGVSFCDAAIVVAVVVVVVRRSRSRVFGTFLSTARVWHMRHPCQVPTMLRRSSSSRATSTSSCERSVACSAARARTASASTSLRKRTAARARCVLLHRRVPHLAPRTARRAPRSARLALRAARLTRG